MKKQLFKTFLLSTSILTFGSAIIPSSAVFANENINQTNISNTLNLEQYRILHTVTLLMILKIIRQLFLFLILI